MKVALDGPTGFIGSHVLKALREDDHEEFREGSYRKATSG